MKIILAKDFSDFCGGCNSTVYIKRFIEVVESEEIQDAWMKKSEPERTKYLGFCICGNIFVLNNV